MHHLVLVFVYMVGSLNFWLFPLAHEGEVGLWHVFVSCAYFLFLVIRARDRNSSWKETPRALVLAPPLLSLHCYPFSFLSSSSLSSSSFSHISIPTFLFFSILPCASLDWLEPSPKGMAHRGALTDLHVVYLTLGLR